jgi:biopolymer transport protein ExbB/TolQ
MLHQLLGRLAQFGGEGALGVLLLLSIASVGVIGQCVWQFTRRRFDVNAFVRQLLPLLRANDLLRAEALTQRVSCSVCTVASAGLLETEKGVAMVRHSLDSAISRERIALENMFGALDELGRLALLLGALGSLCDLLTAVSSGTPSPVVSISTLVDSTLSRALTPMVGGLLVALPAWAARGMLNAHVRRIVRDCEYVASLVLSELTKAELAVTGTTTSHVKTRRVAA